MSGTDTDAEHANRVAAIEEFLEAFRDWLESFDPLAVEMVLLDEVDDAELERLEGRLRRAAPSAARVATRLGLDQVNPGTDWKLVLNPTSGLKPADIERACDNLLGELQADAALPFIAGAQSVPDSVAKALVRAWWPRDSLASPDLERILIQHGLDPHGLGAQSDTARLKEALNALDAPEGLALAADVHSLLVSQGAEDIEEGPWPARFRALSEALASSPPPKAPAGRPVGLRTSSRSGVKSLVPAGPEPTSSAAFFSQQFPRDRWLDLLEQILASVPDAAHSLTHKRYGSRQVVTIDDEYDLQDLAYFALRLVYSDVVHESPAGSVGPKSSRVDFRIPSLDLLVELKYARGENAKEVSEQMMADISYYGSQSNYRGIKHIIFMLYDHGNAMPSWANLRDEMQAIPTANGARVRLLRAAVPAGISSRLPGTAT